MTDFRPETIAAIAEVRAALSLARQGTGDVHAKIGRDVVTDTDVAVEDELRRSLTGAFPWPVIGEERGGEVPNGTPFWVVDPICGTRNFASGIPLFAINVALIEAGRLALSVVGDGSIGEVLIAEAGRGAWRVQEDRTTPLATSDSSSIVDFEAWPKAGPDRDRAAHQFATAIAADCWEVRCFSTTLSLALVATGQVAGCVMFAAPDVVHIAAGALLVAEAGGHVTDISGEPWTIGALSLVCSANERLHQSILEVLGATGA